MSENTSLQRFELVVPEILAPVDEYTRLLEWLSYSTSMREVSLFVLYRMWRDATYNFIYEESNDGERPRFTSWSDFLQEVLAVVEVSRSTVYSRLRTYGILEWLEYSDSDMIRKMGVRPNLYERVLNALFYWDQESRTPVDVKTTEFGRINDPDFKQNVRNFLASVEAFDNVNDAVAHLRSDINGKPNIRVSLSAPEQTIVVSWESEEYDPDTGEVSCSSDAARFTSDGDLPDWVVSALREKYKFG